MGNCVYCGKPAGFLRRKHHECAQKHDQGWAKMVYLATVAALGKEAGGQLEQLDTCLVEIANNSFIPTDQIRKALVAGWEQAVNHFLEDGDLEPEEEKRLALFAERFGLTQEELDKSGAYTRFVKGSVLRELMEDRIPSRFRAIGTLPFNFQKNETLIWAFDDVAYYEEKTRRQYVGGSQGVSIRIAKGIYYRVGSFKGHPVETVERVYMGKGILAVTNKHIYFNSPARTFRVRLDKIVSFIPFSNGIGIQRDASSAKPQFFITGDGWFTYNLLVNTAKLG